MQSKKLDSQKIMQNGWRQGSFLLVDNETEIYIATHCMQEKLPNGLYIVLSQDCDILNNSLEKEPVVELIHTNEVNQCVSELTNGQNPRKLHIKISEKNLYLELFPNERYFIARNYLEVLQAGENVGQALKILIRWVVNRYKRHGFPDQFNSRLKKSRKNIDSIKKILSNNGENTLGLFIHLSTEKELAHDKSYAIQVFMLVRKEHYDNTDTLSRIEEGFNQILSLLREVEGIQPIAESGVRSLDGISVHHYQQLKQWDFDYLSGADGDTANELSC